MLSHRLVLSSFLFALRPSLSLSLFPSLNVLAHTHSLVHVSLVRTRVVFGVEDTQESSNTNIRSIARVPRGPRYFMSPATRASLYIVMLLACHASIERQKQTGSKRVGGSFVYEYVSQFKRLCDLLLVSPRRVRRLCRVACRTLFPANKTVADAVRYETFSLILANIFTAIRIWNTYYETTEIVFASHYRVEIVNIHLFDLRLL